jgi:hypothetical protein
MTDFSTVARLKARKSHRCWECQCVISVGEAYARHAGSYDGRMAVYKVCVGCDDWSTAYIDAARIARFDFDADYPPYVFGDLWVAIAEFCREALGYDPRESS